MTEPGDEGEATEDVLKPIDAWWTVLAVDPLAIRLVRVVRSVPWVSPTRLTAVAHLLGLVSAVCFAAGWLVLAAAVFEVRFVIDCADGKLARAQGRSSAAGAFLDYVGDYLVVGTNVVALSIWLYRDDAIPAALATALPAVFLAHIAAGQAAARQSAAAGAPVALLSETMPGGYRSWMGRRRLKPLPSRIDAEHGLLFVLPIATALAGNTAPLAAGAWVALAYFGLQTLHITRLGWRLARQQDRE